MGIIYKRGKYYFIDLTINGNRIRRKVGSSKRQAKRILEKIELDIVSKNILMQKPDKSITYIFTSFLDFSKINHAPMTYKRYSNVTKNFQIFITIKFPKIKKISHLNPQIFEEYKAFRKIVDPRKIKIPVNFPFHISLNSNKACKRTINYEIKTLRSIFEFGRRMMICKSNPCKEVSLFTITDSKRPRFLTIQECRLFLRYCDANLYPIFYTFINTGLRLGELLNLQWGDIDLCRGKLLVQCKTSWRPKGGERDVPLNSGMQRLFLKMKKDYHDDHDYVFPGKDGNRLKRKLRNDVIRIASKSEISNLSKNHTFRHTFASQLIMKGVDLPTVQQLLGHKDIQTTMVYAHLAPDHLMNAVNILSDEIKLDDASL